MRRFKKGSAVVVTLLLMLGLNSLWLAYATTPAEEMKAAAVVAQLTPVIPPAARGEQCVADTALMRTDHMKFLDHQRDETVIDGVRGKPFSLVECVNCHAQKDPEGMPVRIDAEGQFCASCHAFAAVKIDCFSCHAAVPEQKQLVGWNHLMPGQPISADTEYVNALINNHENFGFAVGPRYTEHHGKTYKANQ